MIGVSSYLLINFWYTRIQANKSAIKAMLVNRVGDMFLTISFFGLFWTFGNLDYATIYSLSPYINETILSIIGLLFLLAAMGKSAQLGLHSWLPDAMEGSLFYIFASQEEQGKSNEVKHKRSLRRFSPKMWSILIALMISGNLVIRVYSNSKTARGVIQFSGFGPNIKRETVSEQLMKYLLDYFSSFCSQGWLLKQEPDKRDGSISTRYSLSTLTYPCFYELYELFYINGKRTLTINNVSKLDILGLAVIVMTSSYRIKMMHRLSVLKSRQRIMPGYVDGLVLDLGRLYTMEERLLLQKHIISLGIPVQLTYTMRRSSAKNLPELVIAEQDLNLAFNKLNKYLLPKYFGLFK